MRFTKYNVNLVAFDSAFRNGNTNSDSCTDPQRPAGRKFRRGGKFGYGYIPSPGTVKGQHSLTAHFDCSGNVSKIKKKHII